MDRNLTEFIFNDSQGKNTFLIYYFREGKRCKLISWESHVGERKYNQCGGHSPGLSLDLFVYKLYCKQPSVRHALETCHDLLIRGFPSSFWTIPLRFFCLSVRWLNWKFNLIIWHIRYEQRSFLNIYFFIIYYLKSYYNLNYYYNLIKSY